VSVPDRWCGIRARLVRALVACGLMPLVALAGPDAGPGAVRAEPPPLPRPDGPNLLILVGDDHAGGTLGIDGDPRQATPCLDRLARQGVRFRRAFCNAPVCTPSRQSFITGRLPHAVGVTVLTTPLPDAALTLGEWLSDWGYATAAFGKMHFNGPRRHGFAERIDVPEWRAFLKAHPPEAGNPRAPWHPFRDPAAVWLNAACKPDGLPSASMEATFFADRAVEFFQNHRATPFALVVGFYEPHSPFRFPRDWEGRYNPADFNAPEVSEADRRDQPNVFKSLTPDDARGIQAAYYSSLSFLDHQVGRVLDALDAAGLAENTVVVYLGDNGYMLGQHGRFEKHCFYEPAIRVPLIIRWPGRLPPGRQVEAMVELVDAFPTLLELLGVPQPPDLHGRSLVPLLKDRPGSEGRDVVFSEYLENEEAMVRSERYKLIVGTGRRVRQDGYVTDHPLPGPYERLFDLQDDSGETTDLGANPELAGTKDELRRRLHDRLVSTRGGVEPVPPDLSEIEAIHWCLVPRDAPPAPPATLRP
jgi:arylsulfatase A-like enzyme